MTDDFSDSSSSWRLGEEEAGEGGEAEASFFALFAGEDVVSSADSSDTGDAGVFKTFNSMEETSVKAGETLELSRTGAGDLAGGGVEGGPGRFLEGEGFGLADVVALLRELEEVDLGMVVVVAGCSQGVLEVVVAVVKTRRGGLNLDGVRDLLGDEPFGTPVGPSSDLASSSSSSSSAEKAAASGFGPFGEYLAAADDDGTAVAVNMAGWKEDGGRGGWRVF